jgi:hypothetical protein
LIEQTFEEANSVLQGKNCAAQSETIPENKFACYGTICFETRQRALQVPSSAVYKTGMNAFVWVKTGTTRKRHRNFSVAKSLQAQGSNGMTTIKSGLSPDEEIALHAGVDDRQRNIFKRKMT